MDKLLQLCFKSIIRNLNGDAELSKKYEQRALEVYKISYFKRKHTFRIKKILSKQIINKLYEMVS